MVAIPTNTNDEDPDDLQAGILNLQVKVWNYQYKIQIFVLAQSCQNIWDEDFVDLWKVVWG